MTRFLIIAGCLLGATAVGAGAFGAHALRERLPQDLLDVFETSCRYQMYHAFALLFLAWASTVWTNAEKVILFASIAFVTGIVLFSGSLYIYVLSGARWPVYLTPVGGTLLIAGWVTSALLVRKR